MAKYGKAAQLAVMLCAAMAAWACEEQLRGDQVSMATSAPAPRNTALRQQGIIGGTATGYKSWQGVIMVHGGMMMTCTGTLIAPNVVLSAGHCVKLKAEPSQGMPAFDYTKNPGQLWIGNGANGWNRLASAKKVLTHPAWQGELSVDAGDLSMILLSKAVTGLPIYKLRDFPMPQSGDPGMIVGYGGNTSDTPTKGSGVHRAGETTLLNVMPKEIEVGQPAGTCQGDSGGPLFTSQNDEWVLTGTTSYGSMACYKDGGSYSVNVLAYCSWLNRAFKELTGQALGLEKCTGCEAEKAKSWGQPCGEGYAPCSQGTTCTMPEGYSFHNHGYCAASCCDFGAVDAYCPDIASGTEKCGFVDIDGALSCTVICTEDDQCPEGTTCQQKVDVEEKICIATEDGPGWTPPTDTGEADGDGTASSSDAGEDDSLASSNKGSCSVITLGRQPMSILQTIVLVRGL